ncbi:zinc ribbon domain-containing protein [Bacillus sp. JJ1533]|uniref:zinc ribbon domain-containing protein n=1 Tax=Bacillus sp. JJ1533 TaxID=3122959 RepID=UPI002FFE888C
MSSQFLLSGLIKCESCNVTMKTKNETPSKSKKQYLYYRCPTCKNKLNINEIHKVIIDEFQKKWSTPINIHWKESISLSKCWIKKLRSKKDTLKQQIQLIKFNESMLPNVNPDIEKKLKETYELQIQYRNIKLMEIESLIEQIGKIMGKTQDEFLHRFKQNINSYTNEELTSLLLLTFKEILVKFDDNRISVKTQYRLSPFVEIEEKTNYYTESI